MNGGGARRLVAVRWAAAKEQNKGHGPQREGGQVFAGARLREGLSLGWSGILERCTSLRNKQMKHSKRIAPTTSLQGVRVPGACCYSTCLCGPSSTSSVSPCYHTHTDHTRSGDSRRGLRGSGRGAAVLLGQAPPVYCQQGAGRAYHCCRCQGVPLGPPAAHGRHRSCLQPLLRPPPPWRG